MGGGGFSDKDLEGILGGGDYNPDKGRGDGRHNINDDPEARMLPETQTIAGVASALAMALIGAVSSYISYQQKKFCFRIQRKWIHPVAACGCACSNIIPRTHGCEQMIKVFQGKGAET